MYIFVAKFSANTSEEKLRERFEEYGIVDTVKIVYDNMTGRSKGFGFIEMENDEDAIAAIADLNGEEFDGRAIIVKKARPKNSRSGGYGHY